MRASKAVVFLLLILTASVAVPAASAGSPTSEGPVRVSIVTDFVVLEIGNCGGSGDYDNGSAPSAGYD